MSLIIEKAKKGEFVLIAEIGVNHFDIAKKMDITPIEAAKLMIREAKEVGIHAVKFQSYKADTIAAKNSPSYWDTKEEVTTSQYELFKKFDSFSFNEYQELSLFSQDIGIEFLSTAFDIDSADYLFDLMDVYKISSSDLTNLPFVEYQAKKGRPIILSVGASNEEEIDRTINTIREWNNNTIVLMHCVLEYPTPYNHANLNRIVSLRNKYPDIIIGYSDHTKPDLYADVIKTAYNLGAIVVEKHFTLDKTIPGNDHYHAMNPKDAKQIIEGIEFLNSIRGSYEIKYLESEVVSRENARRSLVAACDINEGTIITEEMLTFKRPGTGISPTEINKVIASKSSCNITKDTILRFDMLKDLYEEEKK